MTSSKPKKISRVRKTAKTSKKNNKVVMPDLVNLCSGHKIFQWLCYSAIPVVDCEICEELLEL